MRFFSLTCLALLGAAIAAQAEERLVVPTPAGFTLAQTQQDGGVEIRVFLPSGATDSNPPYVVFSQSQPAMAEGVLLPTLIARSFQQVCPSGTVNEPRPTRNRGYQAATIETTCPAGSNGQPAEVQLMKVIIGEDTTQYVVHRWEGVTPTEAALTAARAPWPQPSVRHALFRPRLSRPVPSR